MDEATLREARILVVGSEEVASVLRAEGYRAIKELEPERALVACDRLGPDLIVLDLDLPGLDARGLLAQLLPFTRAGSHVPLLALSADRAIEAKRRAFSLGARDVLPRPPDPAELGLRVRSLLESRYVQLELRGANRVLEQLVAEQARELEDAHREALQRLALVAEYREDDNLEHIERVGRIAALVGRGLGLPSETGGLLRRAAPLYDIGKIALSDGILLKTGKLSDQEFEIMKSHVVIGHKMLSGSRSPLLQMAAELALTHHERWDGRGYMAGLRGPEIPIAGRIVAVADVFDALTHERPYEPAWTVEDAVAEIRRARERQFDPDVVDVFETLDHSSLLRLPAGSADLESPLSRI